MKIKYIGPLAVTAAVAGGRTVEPGELVDVDGELTADESGDLRLITLAGTRLLSAALWEPVGRVKRSPDQDAASTTETDAADPAQEG